VTGNELRPVNLTATQRKRGDPGIVRAPEMALLQPKNLVVRPALLLLLVVAGCGQALVMRAPDASIQPARLVVMEANVELFEISPSHGMVVKEDWTRAAQQNVDLSVQRFAEEKGVRLLDPRTFEEHEYTRFYRWAYRALGQIADRDDGRAFPKVRTVTQWSYDRPLVVS
jgi:hypothetical protein